MVSVLVPSNSRQERRRRDRGPVRRRCRRRCRRRAGDVRRADVRSRAGRDSMSRSARDEGERARRRYGQRVHQDAGRPGLPTAVVLNAGATAAGTSRRIVRARLESSGAFQLVRPRLTTVADRRGVRRAEVARRGGGATLTQHGRRRPATSGGGGVFTDVATIGWTTQLRRSGTSLDALARNNNDNYCDNNDNDGDDDRVFSRRRRAADSISHSGRPASGIWVVLRLRGRASEPAATCRHPRRQISDRSHELVEQRGVETWSGDRMS